jgi:diguanylate cyclase (GGDEF)-like protein
VSIFNEELKSTLFMIEFRQRKVLSIDINYFLLNSSSEVEENVKSIMELDFKPVLIHVVSYMHNTVLVQQLITHLGKTMPQTKVVLLYHEDKTLTKVVTYAYKDAKNTQNITDAILYHIDQDKKFNEQNLSGCKKELLRRYFIDSLTGLPNLYKLRKDLASNEEAGLIIVAVDNFATINNFYGYVIGDYLIEHIAQNLKEIFNQNQIYRYMGTEFAIILDKNIPFYELKEYLLEISQKINNMLVKYLGNEIFIDFTLASCANTSPDNIFSKVSMALKYAKEKQLPFWIYEDRMKFENEYKNNLQISHIIREAIEDSRVIPYFQPIIDNKTSKIVKYECLARLLDKNSNVISPLVFIPISKKIKSYSYITKTIVTKSFETFKSNDLNFSINLSIEDVHNSDIFKFIIDILEKNPSIANRVTFELLESESIDDFEKVNRFVKEVKRYGAMIAIDDFGSGYSNFSYLTKMDVDIIKIDGSLIKDIDTDKSALLVVETIVDFAKKLGIKTIAEYVHSSTVLDKVKEMGIDFSQGFYIDEPSLFIQKED